MLPTSDLTQTADFYRSFARDQAEGESATYVEWGEGVAADEELLGRLAELEPPRRQPNLLFAAARWHGAPAPGGYRPMRDLVLREWSQVSATMRRRSTQTNEPGRCATLLPVLAEIADGAPLALLEVGVSGGLCLHPDRYAYRYLDEDGHEVAEVGEGSPTFECVVDPVAAAHLPDASPHVRWRGGLDLSPLDVTDPQTLDWLRVLVWPEDVARRVRLDEAVAVVGREPRTTVQGDAARDLGPLMARAREEAPDARLVVFHTAVAAYFDDALRAAWPEQVARLCAEHDAVWVSNEGPTVLPGVAASAAAPPPSARHFCLGVDGQARAWTHGHGRSLTWVERV
ncbi:DUF2332 domain-containing protein [Janibacter sp. UYMM211]|uniref:DUF2332 domain-containing protein n=1 Tax=Janibacter sp. UYMM211 TaxID=3156342 RepID=UPI003399C8F2